jgi:hypothetical protein
MDLNSPLFDRIRIRQTCDEPRAAEGPGCQRPDCGQPGLYRAPKGRRQEGQYWRFCLDHVREYNAGYNYFAGMSDDAVVAYQKDAVIGHRPTWSMGVNPDARGTAEKAPERDWDYADPLGILRAGGLGGAGAKARPAEPPRPQRSGPVRKALDVLGLDETADSTAIRSTYKALVKRFHPDANGGDRSFEERLRDIIRAHDTLRAAGLC